MAVTEKMRRKLGSTVVDAARAVQYTNAGTFEFLLDDKGNFYFLEVNTRLQVEHPVTEFITGIDIVKEQIRIAAGERLSFKQGDVTFTGHSIECRVNAEDPETFAPSPGVIHAFSVPGGPGVRVDTFAHSECTISPYYDSMIAKIIVHGRDRQEAIARMRRTLEMTVIEGIKTSIPLHLKILADPDFIAGRLSTSFMERYLAEPKKAATRRPRRGGVVVPVRTLRRARFYPIVDVDVCRGARPGARASLAARLPSTAARASLQLRAKSGCVRRASSTSPRAIVADAAAVRRRGHRQRSRRHRPAGAARPASTSARTICRRRASARSLGDGVVGLVDAHRGSRSTRRCRRRPTTSRSVRSSAPRPRTPATSARGLELVRQAAGAAASRSSRSAASRSTARPSVIAAGAAAVAVITDLLTAAIRTRSASISARSQRPSLGRIWSSFACV